ncbi:unnamed protein product [Boreogadus saida]
MTGERRWASEGLNASQLRISGSRADCSFRYVYVYVCTLTLLGVTVSPAPSKSLCDPPMRADPVTVPLLPSSPCVTPPMRADPVTSLCDPPMRADPVTSLCDPPMRADPVTSLCDPPMRADPLPLRPRSPAARGLSGRGAALQRGGSGLLTPALTLMGTMWCVVSAGLSRGVWRRPSPAWADPPLPGKAPEGEEREDEAHTRVSVVESGCRRPSVPTTFLEFHGTDRKPVPWNGP